MLNYNTTVHSATKFTPHEVLYGRKAGTLTRFPDFNRIETYSNYLDDLISRLSEIQRISAENLIKAKHGSKERFDKHIHPVKFKVGDSIWALKEPRKNKLDHFYTGPYEIVKINDFGGLIIEKDRGKRKTLHPNKAKLASLEQLSKDDFYLYVTDSNLLTKMRFFLILIFGSGCVSSNNHSEGGQPSIGRVTTKSMTSNPGLLYDSFKKVHLIEEESKIISYININNLINMNSYNDHQYQATLNHCKRYFLKEDCHLYLKVQLFQEIYGEL